MAVGILLFAILLGAVGQILLKSGVTQLGAHPRPAQVLMSILTNIRVFAGFFCYGISSLFYLVAISRLPLNYAYPMIALGYVLVTFLSWQFLHESVPFARVIGLSIILFGVMVLALTYSHPEAAAAPTPPPPVTTQPAPPSG